MTQKKHRISPEDIDLKELRKKLKEKKLISDARYAKKLLKDQEEYVCGVCVAWCAICFAVFPEGRRHKRCCPCDVYLKKDVAHVVQYLLLKLKI